MLAQPSLRQNVNTSLKKNLGICRAAVILPFMGLMAELTWRYPMRCPKCEAIDGRAWSVESKSSYEVTVRLRCGKCAHEWAAERRTPLLVSPPPGKLPPENQA